MRAAAVAALFVFALVATATLDFTAKPGLSSPARTACGKERWDVKTLKDTAAASVNLTPHKTTIEQLRKLKVPAGLTQDAPRFIPAETKTYRVNALLMSVKREKDGDLHLVIADPRVGGSMIVEFPASDCLGTRAHDQIIAARQALKEACGDLPDTVGALWTLAGKATLTGVAFFDPIHGQGGVAQNGIELHPVLELTNAECTVIHH